MVETDEFQSLEDRWEALLQEAGVGHNVFSTWLWLSTWWKHYHSSKKPMIIHAEEDGRILAIAPLMSCTYRMKGLAKVRKLEVMGGDVSEYRDILISERGRECLNGMASYLTHHVGRWDWIEAKDVSDASNIVHLSKMYDSGYLRSLHIRRRPTHICPYIWLGKPYSQIIKERSHNLRKNLRKGARQLGEIHKLGLSRYDELGLSPKEAFESFVKLHQKRWAAKGMRGLFAEDGAKSREFHLDISRRFAEKGWLGLYFLTADGEPIAAMHGYEYRQRYCAYLVGLDPDYSRYSVGNLLVMYLVERLSARGFSELDFARGDENWKLSWTDSYRVNLELRLVRKDPMSRLYDYVTWSHTFVELGKELGISLRRCPDSEAGARSKRSPVVATIRRRS